MATVVSAPPPNRADRPDWAAIENSPDFRALLSAKLRFILPAFVFFVAYYFALPILVGYFPTVMEHKVVGNINVAYVFALSQFAMAWIVMGLYVARAHGFDVLAQRVIADVKGRVSR